MSLDVWLTTRDVDGNEIEVFSANVTHNLNRMAQEAGIYYQLWRPEEIDCFFARDIIADVERGLQLLQERPEYFSQFNALNRWGLYENFVPWVEEYLEALKKFPSATIHVSR